MNGHPVRTIVLSATRPDQAIIVQRLNAMDFATLSRNDQLRVASTAVFDELKASFGFERREDARYDGLAFDEFVDKIEADMREQQGSMPDADMAVYISELEHLRESVNEQEIIKPATIRKKANDIRENFERAAHFINISAQSYGSDTQPDAHYSNVISLDNGVTVNNGYAVFIQAEREIAANESRLKDLLERARTLDPAILIMEIMRLNQAITDAKTLRESEELKQQNELLKTYAAMQNAVNETLRQFGEEKEGEVKRVTLFNKTSYADLTDQQKKIVSMFSTLFGKDGQRHPLESARSIERPLMDIVDDKPGYPLVAYTNAQWNTFATELSEVVTLLGQNTQLKMNDINTLRDMSTSQFEAAAKAITRLSELISTISRNT